MDSATQSPSKIVVWVVQSEASPTDQVLPTCPKKPVRTYYIMCPSRSSSNRLARPGLWLRYRRHAGRVRSRWISLAIRQIDRIRCSRDHARIITRSPIAPWHFPFRTTVGSKLRLGKRRHVREHRLSITRSDKVGSSNINNRRIFEPSLSHTRKSKSRKFRQLIERALHADEVYESYAANREIVSWSHIPVSK